MEAEVIYDVPGPSNAEDQNASKTEDEGSVRIRLPTRVKKVKKKEGEYSVRALKVAFVSCAIFYVVTTALLNYFLLADKMCNVEERLLGIFGLLKNANSEELKLKAEFEHILLIKFNETNEQIKESAKRANDRQKQALDREKLLTQSANETNQKLKEWAKNADDRHKQALKMMAEENKKLARSVNETNQKLKELAKNAEDRHKQAVKSDELVVEKLARSADEVNQTRKELVNIADVRYEQMLKNEEEKAAEIKKAFLQQILALKNETRLEKESTEERFKNLSQMIRQNDNAANDKLAHLAKIAERDLWLKQYKFTSNCSLAKKANLTRLSNGKKYYFHTYSKNWIEANKTCASMGLHLATLRDHTDLNVTRAHANATRRGSDWWVSTINYEIPTRYNVRWHDGSELPQNSTLWKYGADKLGGCVYLYTGGKLNGYNCRDNNYFICELPRECY
ncbi:C-type lectin domain family 4 member F-like isoform X2 [Neocloeon triangulifer]|uniref:C-type lectin domain family 4 member F-like isoform X2 n=1 Tax=Neocloeon triangulifer TaxID=2078957 RepID=UPI00286F28AB|nr:C-type lectin domain family 4 member F-like isoform X2 [Neocloeon triangulifer]